MLLDKVKSNCCLTQKVRTHTHFRHRALPGLVVAKYRHCCTKTTSGAQLGHCHRCSQVTIGTTKPQAGVPRRTMQQQQRPLYWPCVAGRADCNQDDCNQERVSIRSGSSGSTQSMKGMRRSLWVTR